MIASAPLYRELESDIETIENDASLVDEINFAGRVEAIDRLEFHILDRLEITLDSNHADDLRKLKSRAASMKERLERINEEILQRLRNRIKSGALIGEQFRSELVNYVGERDDSGKEYDWLDVFVNGLLRLDTPPQETKPRESEMVFYQPTPARVILALIDKANITRNDVFYDLGSGLGQVCILVNLLTGAKSKGVEFEPAYCDYARQCARRLNLPEVEFVNQDARAADYADGTIFFMYTPFRGKLLQQVLRKLEGEAQNRRIRICTYGPCSQQVSAQPWWKCVEQNVGEEYQFAVFDAVK